MNYSRYVLHRLMWFIPTIGVLLILTFILQDHMPGDRVEDVMRKVDFNFEESPIAHRKRYNEISKSLNLNVPAFYFSISPRHTALSFPLSDPRLEANKKIWLKTHGRKKVDSYFRYIDERLSESMVNEDISAFNFWSSLGQSKSDHHVEWKENVVEGISQFEFEEAQKLYSEAQLSTSSFSDSWPTLSWHGAENRFHFQSIGFFTGNWGRSIIDGRPVSQKIGISIIWTILLSILSLIISFFIAIFIGRFAIIRDGQWSEKMISQILFALYAIPVFWLATLLIVFFTTDDYGRWTNIFPSVGVFAIGSESIWTTLAKKWHLLILPLLCMSLGTIAYFYRFVLSGSREEIRRAYFTTALSKGLTFEHALNRHALKNALFPLLGLIAVILPGLISGVLIIEVLFNIPGMGRLMFNSILAQDWNVVTNVVLLSGLMAFIAFIMTDLILHWVNPKFMTDG